MVAFCLAGRRLVPRIEGFSIVFGALGKSMSCVLRGPNDKKTGPTTECAKFTTVHLGLAENGFC